MGPLSKATGRSCRAVHGLPPAAARPAGSAGAFHHQVVGQSSVWPPRPSLPGWD